jgi:hypothetical protein
MPYAANDVRAKLAPSAAPTPEKFSAAEYVEFHEFPAHDKQDNSRTWYARAQNFTIGYTELDSGSVRLDRAGQPDEYVVLLMDDGLAAEIRATGENASASGKTMIVLPPGDSSVEISGSGRIARLVRTSSADLAGLAVNAGSYERAHENIPEFRAWPDPPGGFKIRTYDLTVPPLSKPPFRLYRCTTFMVNFVDPIQGPRPATDLSPHVHDDFEQISMVIDGTYTHHIRWPWTTNRLNWIDDDHRHIGSPSVTVIPPPSLHTSEATSPDRNHLVDLFSPPRFDFSRMDGWVFNAEDYPMPEQ